MHGSQFNRTVAPIDFARVHLDWVSIVLAWFPSFRKRFRRSRPLRYFACKSLCSNNHIPWGAVTLFIFVFHPRLRNGCCNNSTRRVYLADNGVCRINLRIRSRAYKLELLIYKFQVFAITIFLLALKFL